MSSRKKESSKYFAGALMLIALMVIAILLGWYGLEIAKESITNTSTLPATPTTPLFNLSSSIKQTASSNTPASNTTSLTNQTSSSATA